MSTYVHALTDVEIQCGVTLDQVAELLPRGLFFDNRQAFALPGDTAPALGSSTARSAFAGSAEFVGMNPLGMQVYRAVR